MKRSNGIFYLSVSCLLLCGCGDSSDQVDYVALGASDAVGIGAVAPFKGYVFEIEVRLDDNQNCKGADLKNLGILGAKAGDIQNASLPIAKELDPDLITLFTGGNDIISGDSVEEFESQLEKILRELANETQAQVFVANLPNLTLLTRFTENPDPDVTLSRVQAFNAAIARQAAAHGASVVDLFTNLAFAESLVSDDGFHPSQEGHRSIARLFLAQIEPRICTGN